MIRTLLAAVLLGVGLIAGTGTAAAQQIQCTTSYSSGASYTVCRYSAPWSPATVTTCLARTGYCSTVND